MDNQTQILPGLGTPKYPLVPLEITVGRSGMQ